MERVSLESWPLESGRFAQVRNRVKRVFGCWHLKLSLPFTRGEETYQTCVSCGARRRFDLDQWNAVGDFYYPTRRSALYGSHEVRAWRK
jgi:hypothetical protein